VVVEDEAALEVEDQVLAAGLHPLESSAIQLRGREARRPPLAGRADRYLSAGEQFVEAPGDAQDRVALHR
jgi:hypothetical protein